MSSGNTIMSDISQANNLSSASRTPLCRYLTRKSRQSAPNITKPTTGETGTYAEQLQPSEHGESRPLENGHRRIGVEQLESLDCRSLLNNHWLSMQVLDMYCCFVHQTIAFLPEVVLREYSTKE